MSDSIRHNSNTIPNELKSYHAVKVGDGGVFVGIRVKQHLSVGVDGDVRFDALLVLAKELGDGFDLGFGLGEGAAVGVIAGMGGRALSCGGEKEVSI